DTAPLAFDLNLNLVLNLNQRVYSEITITIKRYMEIKNLADMQPFTTKDGSEIRELLAWRNSGIRNQSLAEARLPVGSSTQEHFHIKTEEIYYITHGTGRLRIEEEFQDVGPGEAIAILPGKKHKLW